MGLAILEFEGDDGQSKQFKMDLGSNRFWTYAIGGKEYIRKHGIKFLKNQSHISSLFGPLPESSLGRGILRIPNELIERENNCVQLMSFRTKDRVGPTISEIAVVPRSGGNLGDLPQIALSKELMKVNYQAERVPFDVKEYQMSEAMFLGGLMGTLTNLLPTVIPAVGGILGGLFGKKDGGTGGGAAGKILGAISNPETMKLIETLLKQISGAKSVYVAPQSYIAPMSRSNGPAASGSQFSDAMIAPALLAALPALMPVLEKVLNPQTLKTIMDGVGPEKTIGAVTDSIMKIGNLGLKGQKQVQQHIEAVHPKTDPLDAMIANLSLARSIEQKFIRSGAVEIDFSNITTHQLYGRSRILYRFGEKIAFPIEVKTPRIIKEGILQLIIKDPNDLKILGQKKWKIKDIDAGPLKRAPSFSLAKLNGVKRGEDYLVSAILTWKNKKGKQFGTSREMLITLVGEYSFDRVEESGEPVQLEDTTRYRDYWHNVWKESFTKETKGLDLQCRYYYVLDREKSGLGRMETSATPPEESGLKRKKRKLKTGLKCGLGALNQLMVQMSSQPALNEAELLALKSPDFEDRFHQVAESNVSFRGTAGETVSLWVFPVVKLQKIVLRKISRSNPHGQIDEMDDHSVHFPIPVMAQFVGLTTEK